MKPIVFLLSVFAMTVSVAAQTEKASKPDFSGGWTEVTTADRAQQGQRTMGQRTGQGQRQQGQRQQGQRVQQGQRGQQQGQRQQGQRQQGSYCSLVRFSSCST